MVKNNVDKIIEEIDFVLSQVIEEQPKELIKEIRKSKKIVTLGAGRMGMAAKAFAMRLSHMGLNGFSLGDSNLPSIGKGDLLVVCSGSGETQTIYDLSEISKINGVKLALITGNPQSRIGKIADMIVEIKAPSKIKEIPGFKSIQPMTTLNEQCLTIFLDALVLELMEQLNESSDNMWSRHSKLE